VTSLLESWFSDKHSSFFFVAKNLLEELVRQGNFEISLAYFAEHRKLLGKIKEDSFLKRFERLDLGYYRSIYLTRIKIKSRNFNSPMSVSKTIWNLFQIVLFSAYDLFFLKINKSLESFLVYFSSVYAIPKKIRRLNHISKFLMLYDVHHVTIPELRFPTWFDEVFRTLDKETNYFCISKNTQTDFLRLAGSKIEKENLKVVPIATAQQFIPLPSNDCVPPYLFSLCALAPHKNIPFTIHCFVQFCKKYDILDLCFYLSGSIWRETQQPIQDVLETAGKHKDQIVFLGHIPDTDVNRYYSEALWFVYLSRHEGFGMPPLEAMQAGCPVVCSDNSSLPEVVGNAAITVPCDDEEAVIAAFGEFYFDKTKRDEYRLRGIERAKLFSWGKTAIEMTKIIQEKIL
jgi:glycosyltransferase involved in cell wall biosynthesis